MKLIILAVFALEKIYKIVPETTLLEICGPLDALDKHKLSQWDAQWKYAAFLFLKKTELRPPFFLLIYYQRQHAFVRDIPRDLNLNPEVLLPIE